LVEPRGFKPPVACSGRGDDRSTRDVGTVREANQEMAGVLAERYARAGAADGGPELLGLDRGPLREVGSGDAGGKPQVVLDPRAGPRLATDGDHLDDDRAQALRCAVDGGREPGRTTAHHDQVEAAARQLPDR